jgi:hypothetical protein
MQEKKVKDRKMEDKKMADSLFSCLSFSCLPSKYVKNSLFSNRHLRGPQTCKIQNLMSKKREQFSFQGLRQKAQDPDADQTCIFESLATKNET